MRRACWRRSARRSQVHTRRPARMVTVFKKCTGVVQNHFCCVLRCSRGTAGAANALHCSHTLTPCSTTRKVSCLYCRQGKQDARKRQRQEGDEEEDEEGGQEDRDDERGR